MTSNEVIATHLGYTPLARCSPYPAAKYRLSTGYG